MTPRDPLSPQWEDCKVCGGDHWTKDHVAETVEPDLAAARRYTEDARLAALGHKRLSDGRCEHRWRNRLSRSVHCPFLDGWFEGRAFGAPVCDEHEATIARLRAAPLDVRRVVRAIENVAARHGLQKAPPAPLARIYGYTTTPDDMDAQIAAEYAALGGTP